jgi:ABC-2 type transport system permease protein
MELLMNDTEHGVRLYALSPPLQPGDSITVYFQAELQEQGFNGTSPAKQVEGNGTFLLSQNNRFCSFGYDRSRGAANTCGTETCFIAPIASMDDSVGLHTTGFAQDAHFVEFEATVSTDVDQRIITSGERKKEWVENDRRYAYFVANQPIIPILGFLSAEYDLVKTAWKNGEDIVSVEVFHHPEHVYNAKRLATAATASLEYYSKSFGKYPYTSLRIVEYPRYRNFAISLPNLIAIPEDVAFFATEKNNKPFLLAAHEVAHQWWAHQLVTADVIGSEIVESLAEYSSWMVYKYQFTTKEEQRRKMRRELSNAFWQYRRERNDEPEVPVVFMTDQSVLAYQKGALVLYCLQDYLGEEILNGALKNYFENYASMEPPFATSMQLVDEIRKVTPDSLQYLVDDSFLKITDYEFNLDSATWSRRGDGQYDVELTIRAGKTYSDSIGNKTYVPINDLVEIGLFASTGEDEQPWSNKLGTTLHAQKYWLRDSITTFHITMKEKPAMAEINPFQILLESHGSDGRKEVVELDQL